MAFNEISVAGTRIVRVINFHQTLTLAVLRVNHMMVNIKYFVHRFLLFC